jgi:PDZ domain-containing secreted protein
MSFLMSNFAYIYSQVVPKGPAEGLLEAGDILIHVNGELVTAFVPLEEVLDESVGKNVSFLVQRLVPFLLIFHCFSCTDLNIWTL